MRERRLAQTSRRPTAIAYLAGLAILAFGLALTACGGGSSQTAEEQGPAECRISLVPPPGLITPTIAPSFKAVADTDKGCTVSFQGPQTIVPPNAWATKCTQAPAAPAESVVVSCEGAPKSGVPPTSALALSFECRCEESAGKGPNRTMAVYLF